MRLSEDSAANDLSHSWFGHATTSVHRGPEKECRAGVEGGVEEEDEEVPETQQEILS